MPSALSPQVTQYQLNSEELAALLRAAIGDGYTASFNAPGSSMLPFIHSDDKIFVSSVAEKSIRTGDILAFVLALDGRVIAHRVVKIIDKRFLCKGDNVALHDDGWIAFEDVLGRVEKVERNGKPVRFGMGHEKKLIAHLSFKKWLVPVLNVFREIKWGVIGLFSR